MKFLYTPVRSVFYTAILLIFFQSAMGQPGCPAVSAGNSVVLPCGTSCTTLTATPFQVGSTTSYSVDPIPYTPFPYTGGTAVSLGFDDYWGDTINLPFNFCFFGNVYNQAVVGANGIVTFNTYRAQQYCPWSLTSVSPVPSTSLYDSTFTNSIMCPYQDIDPALGGTISYNIIGTAPCRILVVSYYQVPMFNTADCPGNNCTCQMAIYETTNAIEIYIAQKQFCSVWNGGLAIEGITDNTGTVAFTVPGRNLTQWNATNDAYRFTPNGPSIVAVSWYNGATQISTDSTVQVCPGSRTVYTTKAVYTPCAGGTPVTVTDTVSVTLSGSLSAGVDSFRNISCPGRSDGRIYAHVSGGNPPVNYGWSTGAGGLTLTNLAAGTYVFTASDGSGCVRADTIHITQPTPISISAISTNPACHGVCNGSVATTDTGGTGTYTYSWNTTPVQTTATASGLCSGNFVVTVTDGNSCSATASYALTDPVSVSIAQVSLTNVSCRGESNGAIVVTGSGGTLPYHYQWSNGEAQAQDTALSAGNYTVVVTDTTGCSASANFTVTQPATGISLQAPAITNVACAGINNGAIAAHASGGVGNLTYNWTDLSNGTNYTGASINNLSAGTYFLSITDASGCTDTTSYVLTSATPLLVDSFKVLPALCGHSNGYAQVFVSGGTPVYTYHWIFYPNVTTSIINNIPGTVYTVTTTDANGCSIAGTVVVPQTSPIVVSITALDNVTCHGGSNGDITVALSGGTPPYHYTWSHGNATGLSDSGLQAGGYDLFVTDTTGCVNDFPFLISEPTALLFANPVIQNVGCSGGSTGSITSNVLGGSPAYTYNWSEQSNGTTFSAQTITNLLPDVYELTVSDTHGCSISASYNITAVPPLIYTIDSTNVTCFNGNNGNVTVAVASGTRPLQYLFDNSLSSDSVDANLTAGYVDVIVIDADNCRGHAVINIEQPGQMVIHLNRQTEVLCHGGSNATLSVSATGGTPGYVFNWSNQYTGAYDSALTAGSYSVTVSDTNACTVSQSYLITEPGALLSAPTATNALCNAASDGSINSNPSGGTSPYSFTWSNGANTQIAGNLSRGSYSCTIDDANGCSLVVTDTIGEPTRVTITRDSAIAVKCVSQRNGEIIMASTGGYPPYDYTASQDNVNFIYSTSGILMGLDTGVYTITIADSVGCTSQISVYVPPATLDSFATSADSTLCFGLNDGSVLVTPLPPSSIVNGPYKFGIDASVEPYDTGYFANLSSGLHYVTAINTKGCVSVIPVYVPEPLPIEVVIIPDTINLPLGGSEQVQVVVINANNPAYNWSPANGLSCIDCPNPVVSAYAPGNYVITVSTMIGGATCTGSATLRVNVGRHPRAFTPNAFTPNGDGNNDVFRIYGDDIKTINLKVFNRWGELVFETNNSLSGWDGSFKGVLQSSGVYLYESVITYLDDTQETKNGSITLIR